MKELPTTVAAYKKTPRFNESSIPKGFLKAHHTKEGVWAKIIILRGTLEYKINEPETEIVLLDEDNNGVVEPTIPHEIRAIGSVEFYLEFYR